jgi:hypothetical protein
LGLISLGTLAWQIVMSGRMWKSRATPLVHLMVARMKQERVRERERE